MSDNERRMKRKADRDAQLWRFDYDIDQLKRNVAAIQEAVKQMKNSIDIIMRERKQEIAPT
jgi:hypothetical protein